MAAIADGLVALHSSDPVSVYLSAAARMVAPSIEMVEQALYEDRTVIRHHAMRRTLWVFSPAVARLAHASSTRKLLAPEQRRFEKMIEGTGVTNDGAAWFARARSEVLDALASLGIATTRELGDAVPGLKVPITLSVGKKYEGTLGAHTRVLLLLGFEGAIVRVRPTGSWINGQYRWTSMASWCPGGIDGVDPAKAGASLVNRWLYAFGPASTADVQWWTGWPLAATRHALAACGAEPVTVADGDAWLAAGDLDVVTNDEPSVALLPALDPTAMGWKQRDWYLDPPHTAQLFDRNGNGGPTIFLNGRIVGGWVQRRTGEIATRVFEDVGSEAAAAIGAAAEQLAALLGAVRVTVRFPAALQGELLRDELL